MSLEKYSFERIVENLHDGLYFVDQNRIITYWNKAAELISGFAKRCRLQFLLELPSLAKVIPWKVL